MPEYLLLFRKPQTDRSKGYADEPVEKLKEEYRLSRWQLDAAGFARSSGDRPLTAHDFEGIPHSEIFKLWRRYHLGAVYDYEQHVALNAALEDKHALPVDFSLMPAHSWSEWAWSDIARMRTLNGEQARKNCPLQFDIVDRSIRCFSQPSEVVYDPFAGLGTVPLRAVKLGRVGWGTELSASYYRDALAYLKAEEKNVAMPTLFDLIGLRAQSGEENAIGDAE